MKNKNNFDYSGLVDRNWAFIDKKLQIKIKNTRIFFAGCGGSGLIAQAATRTGFSKFILADGDTTEITNLNRQPYCLSDIGEKKVKSLKSKILDINPDAEVTEVQEYLTSANSEKLIRESDIVINTVDPGKLVFDIISLCQKNKKTVILPINVGFGGFVTIFNGETKSLSELLGVEYIENNIDFYKVILKKLKVKIPQYISEDLERLFEEIQSRGYVPQLGIGVETVGIVVLINIIKLLTNKYVPLAPGYIYIDLFEDRSIFQFPKGKLGPNKKYEEG